MSAIANANRPPSRKRARNVVFLGRLGNDHRGILVFDWMVRNSRRFSVSYRDRTYPVGSRRGIGSRVLLRVRAALDRWVRRLDIRAADLVYVLPMAREHEVRLVRFARGIGTPVLTDFYLSSYDTHVNDRAKVGRDDARSRVLRASDLALLTQSTVTVFLNAAERDHYRSVVAGNERPAWSEDRVVPLVAPERPRAALPYLTGTDDRCVVCWWGTFIPLHGLDTIIGAAAILARTNRPVRFVLLGHDQEKAAPYHETIDRLGLASAIDLRTDLTFANGGLQAFIVERCDVALGAFGTSMKARTVLTNKVVEGCSMGIPTITQAAAALPEFFVDRRDILVCPATAEGIAETVDWVISNRDTARDVGAAALDTYRRTFAPARYLQRMERVIEDVLDRSRSGAKSEGSP